MEVRALQTEEFSKGFSRLVDHWAAVGVWCALWNAEGKLTTPAPQSGGFWKTLWTRGQRFRKAVAQAVLERASEPSVHNLLDIDGLRISCMPIAVGDGKQVIATVCFIEHGHTWGEDFVRLCSEFEIDEQLLRGWAERCACFNEEQVEHILQLLRHESLALLRMTHQQDEVTLMTTQLADTYEELNLIYRVGALMQLTQQPRDHFTELFEVLAQATPITTMAAVLSCSESLQPEDQLIIGGEPIIDEHAVMQLMQCLPAMDSDVRRPLIVNDIATHDELQWVGAWLEQFMAVPIVCNERELGTVLIINRRGQSDFTSIDARLVQSVVDRSAVYLENALLYADLNRLLMGLTRALVSAIDAKDPYTCGHSNRVALLSKHIALRSGATPAEAEQIYLSALLHDVGKIGIPESILCKAGRLTDEEMDIMRQHPEIGARILKGIPQLDDIIPGVMHHHECVSGHGYPDGLSGDGIPYIARVIGLADAYDAMTSGRTYRGALPLSSAMAEIRRCSGTQFDPYLADVLIELIGEGLADELTKLTDGVNNVLDPLTGVSAR